MRYYLRVVLLPVCLSLPSCTSDTADDTPQPQLGVDARADTQAEVADEDAGEDAAEEVDLDAEAGACIVDAYYHPVCGDDGKTYDNAEVAMSCAKVGIAHDGPCEDVEAPDSEPSCSVDAYALPVCGADGTTYFNPDEADCHQVAVAHYDACTTEEEGHSLQDPGCPGDEPGGTCTLTETAKCYYRTTGVVVPDRACGCVQGSWSCEDVVRPDGG